MYDVQKVQMHIVKMNRTNGKNQLNKFYCVKKEYSIERICSIVIEISEENPNMK